MVQRILKVTVLSDFRRYQRDQKELESGFTRFGRRVHDTSGRLQGFGALLVSGSVALGLKRTIDAASDMNETMSKTRVVFGPAAAQVEKFASTAATSLGMSRREAMEATASLGNLFVSMKLGQQPAAQMSTRMVQLASDLASFNNASPAETLEALRAGLVGETEPLRRFGINLNDATLREEALRLGLVKTTKEVLPPAVKAQATYSLVLKQSATAQGDFARTADGAANAQRIATARFEDAKVKLGNQLLPVYTEAVKRTSDLIDAFTKLDAATGGMASKIGLGATALAGLGFVAAKVVGGLLTTRNAWNAYKAAKLAQIPVNATVAASEEALAAKTALAGNAAAAAGTKWSGLLGILGRVAAIAAGIGGIALLAGGDTDQTRLRKLADGLSEAERNWYDVIRAKQAYNALTEKDRTYYDQIDAKVVAYARSVQQLQAEQKYAAMAARDHAAATGEVGDAQAAATGKATALAGKLKELKQGFTEQAASVRDSVLAYDGLITKSGVTARQVVTDLHDQVRNFRTYSVDVQRLIKAGVNPAAIEELSKKGPEFVHALATGSNRQLQIYKGYWRDRQAEIKGGFATSMQQQYEGLAKKIKAMQAEINKLKGKTVTVEAKAKVSLFEQTRQALLALGIKGYGTKFLAVGGPVTGPGGPTADRVPAMLSNGEYVINAKAARALGRSTLDWLNAQRMADGGPVGQFNSIAANVVTRLGTVSADKLAGIIGAALGKAVEKGMGAGLASIKAFIRSTDPLPYIWGGAGPGGYDCSGIVSAVHGKMRGLAGAGRGLRLYTTGTIRPGIHGLKSGLGGTLQIGVTPSRGHMAGRYGGLGFEAESTSTGIKIGPAASRPEGFARRYHLAKGGAITSRMQSLADLLAQAGVAVGGDAGKLRIGSFDRGGWLLPGATLAYNGTGRPERVGGGGFTWTGDVVVYTSGGDGPSIGRQVRAQVLAVLAERDRRARMGGRA